MARGSNSVGHSDPDTRRRKTSSIGALMNFGQSTPSQQSNAPAPMANDNPQSIGSLAQPTASEPPPADNAEFQSRVARNFEWANSPEVQAALMQFAMGMTAPVNSPGDFMGNITRAVGGGFQAASRVHDANIEEQAFLTEEERKNRRLAVDEGQLGISEQRLKLDQAELDQKLKKGTTNNIVVSSENPINKKFNLGIPAGSSAKVAVTINDAGEVTGASVEAGFDTGASGGDKSSPIEQLQKDRAEAQARNDTAAVAELDKKIKLETADPTVKDDSSALEQLQKDRAEAHARGDTKAEAELDLKIATEAAGGNLAPDHMLVPDPENPGQFKQVVIPGSKTAIAAKEEEKASASRNAHGLVAAGIVGINVKKAIQILEDNPMPNVTVTGIGALAAELPLPSDAKSLRNAIQAVKSNVTIETLTAMRQASPTGAAVGNVSDYEDQIMQTSMGTLDQYGKAEDLIDNLRRVNSVMHLIVDSDQIKRIGEQVQAGILTREQGFTEVEKLINADVAKASLEKQAAIEAAAREQTRGGSGLQAGDNAGVPNKLLSKDTALDNPQRLDAPAPAANLTPEEQNAIDVQKQIETMIEEHKNSDRSKDDFVAPNDLSEADMETLDALDSEDEKRVFVQALKMAKTQKRKEPPKPMSSTVAPTGTVAPSEGLGPTMSLGDLIRDMVIGTPSATPTAPVPPTKIIEFGSSNRK